jgi:hypothetical protein
MEGNFCCCSTCQGLSSSGYRLGKPPDTYSLAFGPSTAASKPIILRQAARNKVRSWGSRRFKSRLSPRKSKIGWQSPPSSSRLCNVLQTPYLGGFSGT